MLFAVSLAPLELAGRPWDGLPDVTDGSPFCLSGHAAHNDASRAATEWVR